MVNINLSTFNESQRNNPILSVKKIVSLVIVIVVFSGVYAGTLLYKGFLDNKAAANANEQLKAEQSIKEGSSKDIFDFQARLVLANKEIEKKNISLESLNKIQELMVNGVHLLSYEYDSKTNGITLVSETNNYNLVARQILSFKKSGYLSNVKISETDLREGKISFSVEATINQSNK